MRERDPWVPMTALAKPRLRKFCGVWHCESVDETGQILQAKGSTASEAYSHWRFSDRIYRTNPLFGRMFGKAKRTA